VVSTHHPDGGGVDVDGLDVGRGDRLQGRRLKGDTHDVEKSNSATRCCRSTERLHLVLGYLFPNTGEHGHAAARGVPGEVPEQAPGGVLGEESARDGGAVEPHCRNPVAVLVQPGVRDPAGAGGADVEEVAVAIGACAEHRVGEHDRVRSAHATCLPKLGRWMSW
jgi:hypothetical protein